ncbi:hypothetical protein OH768_47105 [Streptomyces sp. NBC_01622]|nr:hypothetical protein OH768_47105 [Streptomyces sp. NBC_01622]
MALEATVEDSTGGHLVDDVPDSYDLKTGTFFGRRALRHLWIDIPSGHPATENPPGLDPFALLGW